MPKVVMAVSVAAMGMGLFGALQNEARATGEGATVACKDTEHYGNGKLRARICAHGTNPYCDFEDYKLTQNTFLWPQISTLLNRKEQ